MNAINSLGNTLGYGEVFTGAYEKRMEQNWRKDMAAASRADRENAVTASEYLGVSVKISEESKNFMAGIAERKAAQKAAKEEAQKAIGQTENAFMYTGDLKPQYLVFSENLYKNGFYDNMSDEEVKNTEDKLKDITSKMNSLSSSTIRPESVISQKAAQLELNSSVKALREFADSFVPESMRNSFLGLVDQYESYNSAKVEGHKNIYDRNEENINIFKNAKSV